MVEFLLWIVDIPFLVMALVTFITPWGRGILLWRHISKALSKHRKLPTSNSKQKEITGLQTVMRQIQSIIVEQFVCAVLDLLAVIAALLVFITVWHAKDMYDAIKVDSLPSHISDTEHNL